MRYSIVFIAALSASVQAHGVITQVQGANGVNMPGLSVADGTPRDSPSPLSGAEADTSIIRAKEMGGKASALGRTANGPVSAAAAISTFMGGAAGAAAPAAGAGAAGAAAGGAAAGGAKAAKAGGAGGIAAAIAGAAKGGKGAAANKRGLLDALTGGTAAKGGAGGAAAGTKTPKGTTEAGVSAAAGAGAASGLPTTADDGTITMTFHQVNQDGAGPLTAMIDPTSAGTDPAAFQAATVTQNVPGIGIGGLSAASTMDFPVKVQMPAGMTCQGTAGGATNVCVVRMQNAALAGPFGGSAAFTQSTAAKKRAVEYNLRKRHFARGILGKAPCDE
ncbi:hypothetical protein P3342_007108 [Pyrenophora teres f. teres]|uniref:DUF3129 domain containing protein n=1 Tax=Pyrenophora teres f. teres TaxID=97479 RepID=A0A6S6W160_9PLEO|nr:hypothetical protein HRS9139_05610 [Pyrenophora teres f. teres]KAE8840437.1 hypothetical protein PTNB85_03836 [Pyrenophora teres f. teres]KAE8849421.1 hypothetical protein HRS9122_03437 [Pyrenophora teres f. teres]KAE8863936.1 hypothetical protein PTNB29_03900 [Pyrenophora teres f. teres]KAE8866735.1 hypothetical protein PTNB73_04829 [Pyrenophora teres f. teres]